MNFVVTCNTCKSYIYPCSASFITFLDVLFVVEIQYLTNYSTPYNFQRFSRLMQYMQMLHMCPSNVSVP